MIWILLTGFFLIIKFDMFSSTLFSSVVLIISCIFVLIIKIRVSKIQIMTLMVSYFPRKFLTENTTVPSTKLKKQPQILTVQPKVCERYTESECTLQDIQPPGSLLGTQSFCILGGLVRCKGRRFARMASRLLLPTKRYVSGVCLRYELCSPKQKSYTT